MTMTLVQTVTVGAGGSSPITFSSIPQDATDLMILVSARTDYVTDPHDYVNLRFNSSTSGYSWRRLYGTGSSAFSDTNSTQNAIWRWFVKANSTTANTFGNTMIYIPNYTGSQNKLVSLEAVTEDNAAGARQDIVAAIWENSAAISTITLSPYFGSLFLQNTTASLYKITKA